MYKEYREDIDIPIKSWCKEIEKGAMDQAKDLARHPILYKHIALMPDCHQGYGMPIGGVIAAVDSVIPNAVGVDIGCGMCAVETNIDASRMEEMSFVREIINEVKKHVPIGEGKAHRKGQEWDGFRAYLDSIDIETLDFKNENLPKWLDNNCWNLALRNLGTLGGGNHFMEIQKDSEDKVWLMLHSGSRNLGYRIASYYNNLAQSIVDKEKTTIPNKDLAYLSTESDKGKAYIRDMAFALEYALENRGRMMDWFKNSIKKFIPEAEFTREINIHHNYASKEIHYGKEVWVHRKGATSANEGEIGIIPGSMGTSSYIVKGLGNEESFHSCSHGAGRVLGRNQASRSLTLEECNKAMGSVVFDRWKKIRLKKMSCYDFGESPLAYKDIDEVIQSQLDLIEPIVKLSPIGVIKG